MNDIKQTHEVWEDLVDKALSSSLCPTEAVRLEQHMATCNDCRMVHDLVSRAAAAWQAVPDEQMDDTVRDEIGDRIMGQILLEEMSRTPPTRRPSGKWRKPVMVAVFGGLAAAAVALVALSATLWPTAPSPAATPVAVEQPVAGANSSASEPTPVAPVRQQLDAVVTSMEGRGVWTAEGQSQPLPLVVNAKLTAAETIALEPFAQLRLKLDDVSDCVLASGAVVGLDLEPGNFTLDVKRGRLTAHVHKRLPGELFTVRTPAGTVEITGTVFEIEVQPNALAKVSVAEGTVIVRDAADPRNVLAVREGETLRIDWADPQIESLDAEQTTRMLSLFEPTHKSRNELRATTTRASLSDAVASDTPEALFAKAQELRKQGRSRDALDVYKRLIELTDGKPQHAEAIFARSQLLFLVGDYEACARELENNLSVLQDTPYHTMALSYLAKSKAKLAE